MTEDEQNRYLWDQPGVPHSGWECTGVDDLGVPDWTCEMCGYPEVRYVHFMEHDEYPAMLGVGCVCAGKMETFPLEAKRRDRQMRNRARRKESWLHRDWRISRQDNFFLNIEGYNIVVFKYSRGTAAGKYGFRINDPHGGTTWNEDPCESIEEAKEASFYAFMRLTKGPILCPADRCLTCQCGATDIPWGKGLRIQGRFVCMECARKIRDRINEKLGDRPRYPEKMDPGDSSNDREPPDDLAGRILGR